MIVSIITSAYNEECYLPNILSDFLNQNYPHKQIEIVLLNSMSTDQTKEVMLDFQKQYQEEFYGIQVHNNVKRNIAGGFNLGVSVANGDAILKVDAHAHIPVDFVEKSVALLDEGELVGGGARPTIIENDDDWSQALHLVEESMFGSSIANYRKSTREQYVDSIFHGIYRREVLEDIGPVDERLGRTEDNEFHYRLRKAGYQIKFDPKIQSFQYMRPNLRKMLQQKYANGYWIGLTTHVQPECLQKYHYIPFLFVLAQIFTVLLTPVVQWPLWILFFVYLTAMIIVSILSIRKLTVKPVFLLLPLLLWLVHTAYGVGTFIGLIKGIWWRKTYF